MFYANSPKIQFILYHNKPSCACYISKIIILTLQSLLNPVRKKHLFYGVFPIADPIAFIILIINANSHWALSYLVRKSINVGFASGFTWLMFLRWCDIKCMGKRFRLSYPIFLDCDEVLFACFRVSSFKTRVLMKGRRVYYQDAERA